MTSGRKKILIVDDEPDILEVLRVMLEDEGFAVLVDKGNHVEELSEKEHPNLILLDMLLSGKDGREIAQHLKSLPLTQDIPIIMLSAHPHAAGTARAYGVDAFLAKPFEMQDLLDEVEKQLYA
ncbi:response regulator [Ktedonosporobacter rubrisoli]|uniref:Response regulator n=1 Tax=Ktedonosporobacter rubrisoli TaxID=2509675 RepID=A0A4P6JTF9_KTERU|nr:response regulator [Ktedonosporobacter rubrisoli]QBD78593.1 response regulator [Ktedonosporobacter rubrisoli]